MSEPTRMTIAASYSLYSTITSLIFNDDGTEKNIPFKLKYRLLRNRDILEKDVVFFENERNNLIKQLGEADENGNIKVKEENTEEFTKEVSDILKIEVEHNFMKIKPEDIDNFSTNISTQALDLFMAALIDDPEMQNDLNKPINRENSTN